MMTDHLELIDLKVTTKIGIHAWEQHIKQTVLISIGIPLSFPEKTLLLEDVLDYAAISQCIINFVGAGSFDLIENLAGQLGQHLIQTFQLELLDISVSKPLAIPGARTVTIKRRILAKNI